jgi:hypothetical protein
MDCRVTPLSRRPGNDEPVSAAVDQTLKRFQAKWAPVRVKKTRQNQNARAPALIPSKPERL